jgi:hypothetical protein
MADAIERVPPGQVAAVRSDSRGWSRTDNTPFMLVQRLQVAPTPLDRTRPGITFSPDVSGLVMKALERDAEEDFGR